VRRITEKRNIKERPFVVGSKKRGGGDKLDGRGAGGGLSEKDRLKGANVNVAADEK